MLLDLGATAFVGTPSFLMTIIQKAESLGVDFKMTRLKKAITTAEPLTPSLRASLEGYGIKIANIYGTAELGMLGYEPQAGCGFLLPEDKLIQICDPQTGQPLPDGEMGEVVATNFSRDYPLIRIGTGDLSILSGEPTQCGEGPHLLGWMGRSGEAVKVRGMFVHPNQLKMVMSRYAEVSRYQAVITREAQRDHLTLRIATQPGTSTDALCNALTEALPSVVRVKPDHIEIVSGDDIAEGAPAIVDQRTWD
jgi:phenylacetate-CoA ligase